MFNIKLILVITAALTTFISCNGSKTSIKEKKENNSNHSYFPVAEGNTWTYINEAPREETELFTVKINNVKSRDNGTIIELSSFPFFTKVNGQAFVVITNAGDVGLLSSGDKVNVFLPAEGFLTKDYNFTFMGWNGYVYSTHETVLTENGTYENCIGLGYAMGGITFSANIWIAKNVGIVKWGVNRTNPPTLKQSYYVLKKRYFKII